MPISAGFSWPSWSRKLLHSGSAAEKEDGDIRSLPTPLIPTSAAPGGLPFEVLLQVADIIHQEHRPTLSALAQVNKVCYVAAMAWRLRSISFEVTKRQDLRRDVDNFLRVVNPTEGTRHVRWLEVRGCLEPTVAGEEKIPSRPKEPVLHNHICDGTIRDAYSKDTYADFECDGPIEVLPEEDSAWQPVVDLLKAISHLEDFVFTSEENQFPPSLLQALQRHHPTCRLHLPYFRFRSLHEEATDPHEMAVVSSPQLHSIGVKWVRVDSERRDDWNRQALMRLLASGMAPTLKSVILTRCAPMASGRARRMYRPGPPWIGFTPGPWSQGASTTRPSSLQCLTLFDFDPIEAIHLAEWQQHTAFEKLTDLTFETQVSCEALEWAALNVSFPNLRNLIMKVVIHVMEQGAPGSQSPATFLARLRPLESLRLTGNINDGTIDSIIAQHGPTLRSLTLDPISGRSRSAGPWHQPSTYGRDRILQLRDACPRLEKLSLPIRRQMGERDEVDIYRALAEIPSLTDITLELRGYHREEAGPIEPFGDPFKDMPFEKKAPMPDEVPLRNGDVMKTLLNCAMDEALARAIWDVMATGKAGRPLRSLQLGLRDGPAYRGRGNSGGFGVVTEHLQRAYLLECSVRDDVPAVAAAPTVVELGREKREAGDERDRWNRRDYLRRYAEMHPGEPPPPMWASNCMGEVLRRLWPKKKGSYDWRDDWESLPLDLGQD
ncbi:hypothetical protein PG996_008288 [Apiospora saccharicola]|uniref:F-box domain-containing protein n=1 Tax=Apiospora saccharicola TaxID=335842 RepID=A0ABR1V007_9PEZI